jgi:trimeric autotransporter adhesin
MIAKGTFNDGSMQQLASVTWSSSNAAIASIANDASNSGVAFGIAAGTTTITATAGSVSGSATLSAQ